MYTSTASVSFHTFILALPSASGGALSGRKSCERPYWSPSVPEGVWPELEETRLL